MNSDEFTEAKRLAMEYYARSLADLQKGYNHSQILEALCFSTVILLACDRPYFRTRKP